MGKDRHQDHLTDQWDPSTWCLSKGAPLGSPNVPDRSEGKNVSSILHRKHEPCPPTAAPSTPQCIPFGNITDADVHSLPLSTPSPSLVTYLE